MKHDGDSGDWSGSIHLYKYWIEIYKKWHAKNIVVKDNNNNTNNK